MRSYAVTAPVTYGDTIPELQRSALEQARELTGETLALYRIPSWLTYHQTGGAEHRQYLRDHPKRSSDKKLWRAFVTVNVQVPEGPCDWLRVMLRELREHWVLQ